jgi:hypothetical protein
VPTNRFALLYSLEAITTYGHSDLFLGEHWRWRPGRACVL